MSSAIEAEGLGRDYGAVRALEGLDLTVPRHMQLLKDDYLRWSFNEYTKQAVARAKVSGWKSALTRSM